MAIENIGGQNSLLQTLNAKKWTGQLNTEMSGSLGIKDAPSIGSGIETKQSFSELLAKSVGDVNSLQKDADVAIQKLVSGQSSNIHETMLAVEKAEIAFKTMNQVRMKVIDAYKEVMRMQV